MKILCDGRWVERSCILCDLGYEPHGVAGDGLRWHLLQERGMTFSYGCPAQVRDLPVAIVQVPGRPALLVLAEEEQA